MLHRELPFPADNGGRLRAAHMLRYLCRQHEVELACFTDSVDPFDFPDADRLCGITAIPRPSPVAWGRTARACVPAEVLHLQSPRMARHISEAIRRFSPDVLMAGDPALSPYFAPYRDRVRVLDYLMVLTLSLERLAALSRGWQRVLWNLRWYKQAAYHRRIAGQYHLCLVNSREDYADLLTHSPHWRRVEFVPNGLWLDDYPLGLAPVEPRTLIYPGAVGYAPNRDAVQYFIEQILPRVRAEVPDVRLMVTGKVPADGSAPIAPGVVYSGHLPDVRPAIASAQLCVIPLRSGAGGARFKLLESLALGTPVVSTSIGAEGVEGQRGKDYWVADGPVEFASQVTRLLKSTELRRHGSASGRRLIEREYDWNRLGTRVDGMLRELVEKQPFHASGVPPA